MLVLGHAGITLGAAAIADAALSKTPLLQTSSSPALLDAPGNSKTSWFSSLANHVDIRILLVGSLLPDIIDKPVGQILFRDTFSNGRIFCHTLLFLLVITLAGLYRYKRNRKMWLLTLSFGTLMHLTLDQMWLSSQTLLWPLYGFAFPRVDLSRWLENILIALRTVPSVYVPEIIGALVLSIFLWQLMRSRALNSFIIKGTIEKGRRLAMSIDNR